MPYNEGPPFAEVPARIAAVPGVTSRPPGRDRASCFVDGSPATVWVAPCADVARQFELSAADCGPTPIHWSGVSTTSRPATTRSSRTAVDRVAVDADRRGRGRGIRHRSPNERRSPTACRLSSSNRARIEATGPAPSPTKFYVDTDGSAATAERVRTAVMADVADRVRAPRGRGPSRRRAIYEEFGRVVGLGLIALADPRRVQPGCRGDDRHPRATPAVRPAAERRDARVAAAGARPAPGRCAARGRRGCSARSLGIVVAQVILRLAEATTVPWPDASLAADARREPGGAHRASSR